jgi:multiple sugar transport system ATP-binding protein
MNFASTKLEKSHDKLSFMIGDQKIVAHDQLLSDKPALEGFVGKDVIVGIRPQDFEDASLSSDSPEDCRIKVKFELVEAIGTETLVHFDVHAPIAVTDEMRELAADLGKDAGFEKQAKEGKNEFVGQLDAKSKVKEGESGELTIDTTRLHFFDPESNKSINDGK